MSWKSLSQAVRGKIARRRHRLEGVHLIEDPAYRLFCVLLERGELVLDVGSDEGHFMMLCHELNHKQLIGLEGIWEQYQKCAQLFPKFTQHRLVLGAGKGETIVKRKTKGNDLKLENVPMVALDLLAADLEQVAWLHIGQHVDLNLLLKGAGQTLKQQKPGLLIAPGTRIYPGTLEQLKALGYTAHSADQGVLTPTTLESGLNVWTQGCVFFLCAGHRHS